RARFAPQSHHSSDIGRSSSADTLQKVVVHSPPAHADRPMSFLPDDGNTGLFRRPAGARKSKRDVALRAPWCDQKRISARLASHAESSLKASDLAVAACPSAIPRPGDIHPHHAPDPEAQHIPLHLPKARAPKHPF